MAKAANLIGLKYGMLTVVSRAENTKNGKTRWNCVCDCGKQKKNPVTNYDLVSGKVKSCGCLYKVINIGKNRTHGETKTRLHRIWCGMKMRCKNDRDYTNVSVCKEWENYTAFRKWAISNGYEEHLTIDRIDNSKGYSPDNCRWATFKEQENNRTNNFIITVKNVSHTAAEWSDITGIKSATLIWRAKHGWDENDIFIKPNLSNKWIRRKNK